MYTVENNIKQIKRTGNIFVSIFCFGLSGFFAHGLITNIATISFFSETFFLEFFVIVILIFTGVICLTFRYSYTDEYLEIRQLGFKYTIPLKSIVGFTPSIIGTYAVIVGATTYSLMVPFAKKQIKEFSIILKKTKSNLCGFNKRD